MVDNSQRYAIELAKAYACETQSDCIRRVWNIVRFHSVVLSAGHGINGDLQALSRLWRQKQLEFTWLRALMERYEDFWWITEAALRSTVRQLSIDLTDPQLNQLMQAYLAQSAFADARSALETLKGIPLAILSNGSPTMLDSAVRNSGLEPCFAAVISADRVKTYKPSRRVYALGPEILRVPAEEIIFVSSNSWDVAGAKAFGYQVCWCNRAEEKMDDWGFAPDFIVSRLDQIPDHIQVAAQ